MPPLDVSDVKDWIKTLGADALQDGFTPFPINMVGPMDDYILATSAENCAAYKTASENVKKSASFQATVQSFASFFTQLETLTGEKSVDYDSAVQICEYLAAADLHNKELTFALDQATLDKCHSLIDSTLVYQVTGDDMLWQLGSVDLFMEAVDHMKAQSG